MSVLLAVGLPGLADAQVSHAPPGNSAVEQYQEVVPDVGGNRPTSDVGSGPEGPALPERTQIQLGAEGTAGAAVARFTEATAPKAIRKSLPKPGIDAAKPSSDPAFSADSSGGDSPASSALDATLTSERTPGGSMGIALPAILVATLLGGGLLALRRRRTLA